jgi:glycosyltransferase involved in cell wall biosynthesis
MGALASAVLGFHLVKTAGLLFNGSAFPVLRRAGHPSFQPSSSLLVPARNEALVLRRTLLSLMKQPAAEILVLDDESTDDTAQIVKELSTSDSRLRLLTGRPKPPGWIGKNWACHQLASEATGELLVFVDADVSWRPGALAALWQEMSAQAASVFSVFPRQEAITIGERFLVPLIDENLLAFLPFPLLELPIPAAAVANGQTLALTRVAYETLGGHEAVHDEIVEDLALARLTRRRGLKLGLALGGELIQTRMYRGYRESVRGMGKSLRSAHGGSDPLLAASAAFVLIAYTLPWLLTGHPAWRVSALLGLAERVLTNAKTGRGCYAEAVLVPFTAPAALPVYAQGLRRTAVWKGRSYR